MSVMTSDVDTTYEVLKARYTHVLVKLDTKITEYLSKRLGIEGKQNGSKD